MFAQVLDLCVSVWFVDLEDFSQKKCVRLEVQSVNVKKVNSSFDYFVFIIQYLG